MKNNIILVIIIAITLLLFSCTPNELEMDNNNIEEKTVEYRLIKECTEATNQIFGTITYKYDINGNLIEKCIENSDKYKETITYKCNKSGKVIEENSFKELSVAIFITRTYKYDRDEDLIEQYSEYEPEHWKMISYEYDNEKRLIKEQHKSENGKQNTKINEYDIYGNLIKEYSENNYSKNIVEYKYDVDGKLIKKYTLSKYTPTVDLEMTEKYEYNLDGKLLKKYVNLILNGEESFEIMMYEYDKRGFLINEYSERDEKNFRTYEYDKAGNLIKEHFNLDDYWFTKTYEYEKVCE